MTVTMSESWCTCRRDFPTGWIKTGCPTHDRPEPEREKTLEADIWIKDGILVKNRFGEKSLQVSGILPDGKYKLVRL